MSNRARYTRQNIISNSYYQLPKFLFDDEFAGLSNDARVLYALLRNRHEISIKNDWYDENDEVYLYFKREDMQDIMKRSENTIAKAMKELKNYSLLEEVRQGVMKPNRIYLFSALVEEFGIETAETLENTMTLNICGSRTSEIEGHDPQNLRVNKNQKSKNQNNINNQVLSSQSDGQDGTDEHTIRFYTEYIKSAIRYEDLAAAYPNDIELVDEMILIMLDVMVNTSKTIWLDNENKSRALIKGALMKVGYEDIEHVIRRFKAYTKPIAKKKQFLLTMLYNSKSELNAHYMNLVKANENKQREEK